MGTLGERNSAAAGINPEGEAFGNAEIPTVNPNNSPFLEFRAFLCRKGLMTDLGTVGGNDSQATGIDSEHRVVGSSQTGEPDPVFGRQQRTGRCQFVKSV